MCIYICRKLRLFGFVFQLFVNMCNRIISGVIWGKFYLPDKVFLFLDTLAGIHVHIHLPKAEVVWIRIATFRQYVWGIADLLWWWFMPMEQLIHGFNLIHFSNGIFYYYALLSIVSRVMGSEERDSIIILLLFISHYSTYSKLLLLLLFCFRL
jgi:hypothetical protein